MFSMDGTIAPLKEITRLAEKYDALVFVDDCHATGFLGPTGRGTAEYWGVEDKVRDSRLHISLLYFKELPNIH